MSIKEDRIEAQKMYEDGFQLFDAVELKRIELTRTMIKLGCPINAIDPKGGSSALHCAVEIGDPDQVKLLLAHGADVNFKDSDGWTPINYIGWKENVSIVSILCCEIILRLLLDARPQLDICDNYGRMQTWTIFMDGTRRAVEMLLDYGVDLTIGDGDGCTPLHFLSRNRHKNVFLMLEDRNFEPNVKDSHGLSPLHKAAFHLNADYIRILLTKGADCEVNTRPPSAGLTPLGLVLLKFTTTRAIEQLRRALRREIWPKLVVEVRRVVKLLVENGANINRALPSGETICEIAIKCDIPEMVKPILKHLAIIEAKRLPTQRCLEDIRVNAHVNNYYNECEQEIERMRSLKVCGNVSFFNILVDSIDKVSKCARDPNFVGCFKTTNIDVQFPRYAKLLKVKCGKAMKRQQLKQNAAETLCESLRLFDSTHIVIERIISYLNVNDLRQLL